MGFENLPTKFLVLRKNAESIEVTAKTKNEADTASEIVSLDNFFDTFLSDSVTKLRKITVLKLPYCQLTHLPSEFDNMNLKHLDLSHNKYTHVPACVYTGFKGLQYLDLSHNCIQTFEMSPACVHHIKNVKVNNNLLESIPKWIINFQSTNLEELDFSFNKAKHYNYKKNSYNIHKMRLRKLKLKNSQLIDDDFNFLKIFTYLEYLDVSNKGEKFVNKLYEVDNLFVKMKWKHLKILKMSNLDMPLFPSGIFWIESLTELYINHNNISWFPDGIEFMVNIRKLDVSDNNIIAIPSQLVQLELLEILYAANNYIDICPDLTKMPSLKILDLYNNGLEHVKLNYDLLESLDLDQNYFDTTEFSNYKEKKRMIRMHLDKFDKRLNLPKIKEGEDDDKNHSYTRSNSEDEDSSVVVPINRTIVDETEDWDLDTKIIERNPDIDSADESWEGEESRISIRKCNKNKKIYVEDEDWMFEDVEESVK